MIDDNEGVGSESFLPQSDEQTAPEAETDELQVGENGTDEEAETTEEPEAEAEEKPKGKSVQERIDEITAARREAEREAEYWRSKALDKQPETQSEAQPDAEPDPENYEFGEADPRYLKDIVRHEMRQELAQKRQRASVASAVEKLDANYSQRLESVKDELPDYDEKVTQSAKRGEWPLPPLLAIASKESEVGPKVLYHLATNREEAIAISRLSPIEQAVAFGRLEAKFLGAPAVQPNIATNSPEPAPARTKGGQFAPSSGLDDRLSQDEWLRRRNAQVRA
jgi:hypothetical protein